MLVVLVAPHADGEREGQNPERECEMGKLVPEKGSMVFVS
jgi:hypothetical protein